MGRVLYNGLHWNNPPSLDPTYGAQPQYKAGQQFSSAFVVALGDISYTDPSGNVYSTSYNGWQDIVKYINTSTSRTSEVVIRLYWPQGNAMNGNPGQTLGQQFYSKIVKPAVVLGVHNFQVLNELNLEYSKYNNDPGGLAGDMYNIAYWIKHQAQIDGIGNVYLGFPGPGGDIGNPSNSGWASYWNNFAAIIKQTTDQGNAYNWLGVHTYEFSGNGLQTRMTAQYDDLVNRFINYPHRYTEYSIPVSQFGGNYQNRANDLKTAIKNFKTHVETKNPSGPDVYSLFYYIAFSSGGDDTTYNLVVDNNTTDLGPAQTLASAF